MFDRLLTSHVEKRCFTGKTILILGARQVGKTTLLNILADKVSAPTEWINADNPEDRALLDGINSERARQLFRGGSVVFIDEAQRLQNTGLTLKIVHDACPEVQFIATGSSAFELSDKITEAMTGRKWTFRLYPISVEEMIDHSGALSLERTLETRLLYGSYPDVVNRAGEERLVLQELTTDYLYKDVFALRDLRKPEFLEKLVKAVAFQIGNEVSYRELAQIAGIDKETVERYIRLLEEAFVVFRLPSFSRNLRTELKKSRKIYFYDIGIRNAVIQQFQPLDLRNDVGQLWENFLIAERRKYMDNHGLPYAPYFWRTHRQQEIDYIEEVDGKISAYEFEWNPKRKVRWPKTFREGYPDAELNAISRDNYLQFLI